MLSVHTNILLTPGVHPSCRSRVVVNEIRSTLRRGTLFPARRELTSTCRRSPCSHHLRCRCVRRATVPRRVRGLGGRASASPVLRKDPLLMTLPLGICISFYLASLLDFVIRSCRSIPCRGPSVMINIVCSSQLVFSPLPASRKSSLLVREGACRIGALPIWLRAAWSISRPWRRCETRRRWTSRR